MHTAGISTLTIAMLLLTACSTTRLALEPIESRREVPLSYRTGWELGALGSDNAPAAAAAEDSQRVQVAFVRLSLSESEALFGPIGARPAALEVAAADVERLLAAVHEQCVERLVDIGTVALGGDRPHEIRISKQCAYIAAFECSQTADMAIADPIVEVIEDGCRLRLTADLPEAAAGLDLEVEFVLSDLERPMRERRIELPGSRIPVRVQEPACLTQRIQTAGSLSAVNALLLAGIPMRESGQTLLVVLRLE